VYLNTEMENELQHMSNSSYLTTASDFYERVAESPEIGLCCVGGAQLTLPDLCIPADMEAMSYGCGRASNRRTRKCAARPLRRHGWRHRPGLYQRSKLPRYVL